MGRFFKKMWYVISKCLNTHGRVGSKLESRISNLNGIEKQFNQQKFWIMWEGQQLNGSACLSTDVVY
jgi:hypothetical protein